MLDYCVANAPRKRKEYKVPINKCKHEWEEDFQRGINSCIKCAIVSNARVYDISYEETLDFKGKVPYKYKRINYFNKLVLSLNPVPPYSERECLHYLFLEIERVFCKVRTRHKRKNMISYNFMLMELIPRFQGLLQLPSEKRRVRKIRVIWDDIVSLSLPLQRFLTVL